MDGLCSVEVVGAVRQIEVREGFSLLQIEVSQPVRGRVLTELHDCILPGDVKLRGTSELMSDSIVNVRGPLKTVQRLAPAALGLPEGATIPAKEIVIAEGVILGRHFADVPF